MVNVINVEGIDGNTELGIIHKKEKTKKAHYSDSNDNELPLLQCLLFVSK